MKNIHEELKAGKMPKHVGIIMDGNGRWAKKRNMPRYLGHREGSLRVLDIVKEAYKLGIPYLSLYAFSTENWTRPKKEIDHLMNLLQNFLGKHIDEMHKNNIKLVVLGDISVFPEKMKQAIENALILTKNNSRMVVDIALNYGGRNEILMAAKKIASMARTADLTEDEVTFELFEEQLYTAGQPPLDLIIRPSGELRVSNFMLYQMAYAEFWFSDVLWPDFKPEVFRLAIKDFQLRNRRFGGI